MTNQHTSTVQSACSFHPYDCVHICHANQMISATHQDGQRSISEISYVSSLYIILITIIIILIIMIIIIISTVALHWAPGAPPVRVENQAAQIQPGWIPFGDHPLKLERYRYRDD